MALSVQSVYLRINVNAMLYPTGVRLSADRRARNMSLED